MTLLARVSGKLTIPAWVNALAQAGHSAPSADNSQPWLFAWDGKYLSLDFDADRCASGLGRSHPVVQMAFGAVIENMIRTAVADGIDVEHWDLRYLTCQDGPFLVVPTPTQAWDIQKPPDWIISRHTNRAGYTRNPIPDDVVSELTREHENDVRILVYQDKKAIHKLGQLVGMASEIRFQTEDVHRWLNASLRFTATEVERGDGLDIETLALPPGGRHLLRFISDWDRMAFLNRLHAYKFLALVEKMQFGQCGAAVLIADNSSGGASSWITAGRLMERAWLLLNKRGISVHPYFVLPDTFYRLNAGLVPSHLRVKAREITESTRAFLKQDTCMPFMVLRVGVAKSAAKRSRRLPLDTVFSHQKINSV